MENDLSLSLQSIERMRDRIQHLPDDPYLLYASEPHSGSMQGKNELPLKEKVVAAIMKAGKKGDLIGIYAGGRDVQWIFQFPGTEKLARKLFF